MDSYDNCVKKSYETRPVTVKSGMKCESIKGERLDSLSSIPVSYEYIERIWFELQSKYKTGKKPQTKQFSNKF